MFYFVYKITKFERQRPTETNIISEPKLLFFSDKFLDATKYMKESLIIKMIENIGLTNYQHFEYCILKTNTGIFNFNVSYADVTVSDVFSSNNIDIAKSKYTLEDFKEPSDSYLKEFVDLLNERLQKYQTILKKSHNLIKDNEIQLYERYTADKNAYLMMKQDGLDPPNPAYLGWSLKQLQELSFEVYKQNLYTPQMSSDHSSLFM